MRDGLPELVERHASVAPELHAVARSLEPRVALVVVLVDVRLEGPTCSPPSTTRARAGSRTGTARLRLGSPSRASSLTRTTFVVQKGVKEFVYYGSTIADSKKCWDKHKEEVLKAIEEPACHRSAPWLPGPKQQLYVLLKTAESAGSARTTGERPGERKRRGD